MKPYQKIPILECGEPLVEVPLIFPRECPHPYVALGAPYGEYSPFYLRQGVIERLAHAQKQLEQRSANWRLKIFDAYRPIPVQQFMVQYTFEQEAQAQGVEPQTLSEAEREALMARVYQFWAPPSTDPATPPPHSTGGALDVTLVDESSQEIDMGSPIDEISDRSYPDYFTTVAPKVHHHRQILKQTMLDAGFRQHQNEWWHFSYGDQMWVWLNQQSEENAPKQALYGRAPKST
jgi:zinc D-Ala-D-Ala dipeptidase